MNTLAALAADCASAGSETRWGLTLVLATVVVVGGVAIVVLALGSMVRVGAILAIPVVIAALLAVQLHTQPSAQDCSPAIPPLPPTVGDPTPLVSAASPPNLQPSGRQTASPVRPVPPAIDQPGAPPAFTASAATTGSGTGAAPSPTPLPELNVPATLMITAADVVGDAVVVSLGSRPGPTVVALEVLTWVDGEVPGGRWRTVGPIDDTQVALDVDSTGQPWQAATTYWVQLRATHRAGPGRPTPPTAVTLLTDVAGVDPVGGVGGPG